MSKKIQRASDKKEKEAKPVAKMGSLVKSVKKRNGAVVAFDLSRISNAIYKSMLDVNEGSMEEAELVAHKVYAELVRIVKKHKDFVPTVEGMQDMVEQQLMQSDYVKAAKAYIIYRQERTKLRENGVAVPEHVKKLAAESKKNFRNALGEFIYYRTYSRWIDTEGRRETWVETVDRYMGFMRENLGAKLKESEYKEVREAILKQEFEYLWRK